MVVCSSPSQCGTSQSTPLLGLVSSHPFLPPIDVGPPPNPPPLGSSVLTGISPCVYPIRGTVRRLTYRPVSGSDIIYNDPDPQLTYIVLFGQISGVLL